MAPPTVGRPRHESDRVCGLGWPSLANIRREQWCLPACLPSCPGLGRPSKRMRRSILTRTCRSHSYRLTAHVLKEIFCLASWRLFGYRIAFVIPRFSVVFSVGYQDVLFPPAFVWLASCFLGCGLIWLQTNGANATSRSGERVGDFCKGVRSVQVKDVPEDCNGSG